MSEVQHNKEMPFTEHLEELRQALIISFISIVITTGFCFYFNKELLDFLTLPLTENVRNVQLIFVSPGEAFMATIRASLLSGLIFALPIIVNRIYWFVSPGLTKQEKIISLPIVIASYVLFVTGVTFSYKILLPFGVKFLVEFAPANIQAMISIGNYVSFASTLMLGTGLIFELPLVIVFLGLVGIVSSALLKKHRKNAFLASFVIGAIITPSVDIVTQSLLAGALYLLYELSIISVVLIDKFKKGKVT